MQPAVSQLNTSELLKEYWATRSKESFDVFRKYINYPEIKTNWFTSSLHATLQNFYHDFIDGKKPFLIIETPPQHGKSTTIIDFIAWVTGKHPETRAIYASISDFLGTRANRMIKRTYQKDKYAHMFPHLSGIGDRSKGLSNSRFIEFPGFPGYFRNTTIKGMIVGESLDLGVIDDPVKSQAAANSPLERQLTWDWFQGDFFPRLSEFAGVLMTLTRWHVDDLAGMLKNTDVKMHTVSYQAIAEVDEKHRKEGGPLHPRIKSLEFLLTRKKLMHDLRWAALYQQKPSTEKGNIFKDRYWHWWGVLPNLKYKFISADTAQKTKTYNDYTVLQAWGVGVDDCIYLLDMVRARLEAPDLEKTVTVFYKKHDNLKIKVDTPTLRGMLIEDKSSGSSLIQSLERKKFKVIAVQRNTDKVARAYDTSPFCKAGRVYLNEDIPFISELTGEAREFPTGRFDDTIDTLMTAVESVFLTKVLTSGLQAAMEAD